MFGGFNVPLFNTESLYILYNNIILLVILAFACTDIPIRFVRKITLYFTRIGNESKVYFWLYCLLQNGYLVSVFLVSVAYLVDASYNPFLYFRF